MKIAKAVRCRYEYQLDLPMGPCWIGEIAGLGDAIINWEEENGLPYMKASKVMVVESVDTLVASFNTLAWPGENVRLSTATMNLIDRLPWTRTRYVCFLHPLDIWASEVFDTGSGKPVTNDAILEDIMFAIDETVLSFLTLQYDSEAGVEREWFEEAAIETDAGTNDILPEGEATGLYLLHTELRPFFISKVENSYISNVWRPHKGGVRRLIQPVFLDEETSMLVIICPWHTGRIITNKEEIDVSACVCDKWNRSKYLVIIWVGTGDILLVECATGQCVRPKEVRTEILSKLSEEILLKAVRTATVIERNERVVIG